MNRPIFVLFKDTFTTFYFM